MSNSILELSYIDNPSACIWNIQRPDGRLWNEISFFQKLGSIGGKGCMSKERTGCVAVRRLRTLCLRITTRRVLGTLVVMLVGLSIHLAVAYQQSEVDRVNGLALILMQARGPLSESIHMMAQTVTRRQIDVGLWDLMLRNLIEHWRFYPAISWLDRNHRSQWLVIQDAIDRLIHAVTDVIQHCSKRGISLLCLTDTSSGSVESVRDALALIETNAFPTHISVGSDPRIFFLDASLAKAVEAAYLLQIRSGELQSCIRS
jgi:hypothetical protein